MKNMIKLGAVALIAGLAIGCAPAKAADWTYASIGYTYTDAKDKVTNRRASGDGVIGEISYAVTDWMFVQGRLEKSADADFDTSVAGLSLGLNKSLDDRTDIYGKVSATSVVENRRDLNKYGYEFETGVRAQITERFELRGGVIATELRSQRLDSVRYLGTAGVEFALTPSIRLAADVRGKDGLFEGQAGVRLYF